MRDMNLSEFKSSLRSDEPPAGIRGGLTALWYDGKNDWVSAHTVAQDIDTPNGAWVHAYLHRREGDPGNARYWYNRAGKSMPAYTLEKEWEEIVSVLLLER
jgi:hypothetical protein